jgi:hypothetical protein
MTQFFKAIFLLTILFIGLLLYYTIKNIRYKFKKRRSGNLLFNKIYEDEKAYIRNRMKSLLADLQEGKIRWLLISSRLFPENQIQITYTEIEREVTIIQHGRNLRGDEQDYLRRQLGVNKYCTQPGKIILSTTLNSKIVTDLIYFLFENIYNQQKVHNIKINISGE